MPTNPSIFDAIALANMSAETGIPMSVLTIELDYSYPVTCHRLKTARRMGMQVPVLPFNSLRRGR